MRLSNQERMNLQKTASTIGELVKTKVTVVDGGNNPSSITRNGEGYFTRINTSKTKPDAQTKLESELAHLLFSSPIDKLEDVVKSIYEKTPNLPALKKVIGFPKYYAFATNFIKAGFNILEDERVESNWGKLYAGSNESFEEAKNFYGNQMGNTPVTDPINALLATRFGRSDLIQGTEFEEMQELFEQVRGTGKLGAVACTNQYYTKFVIPWLQKNAEMLQQPPPQEGDEGEGEDSEGEEGDDRSIPMKGKKKSKKSKEAKSSDKTKATDFIDDLQNEEDESEESDDSEKSKDGEDEGEGKSEEKTDAPTKEELDSLEKKLENREKFLERLTEYNKKQRELEEKLKDSSEKAEQCVKESSEMNTYFQPVKHTSKSETEKALEDFATATGFSDYMKSSEGEIQQFMRVIKNHSYGDFDTSVTLANLHGKVSVDSRPRANFKPDMLLARQLNQMFKQIKAKQVDEMEVAGIEADMDEYLQDRLNRRTGMFWNDPKQEHGLSIAIGIDCSGSMGNDDLRVARDLCGTFYKSLEGITGVELTIVPWSTGHGHDLSVTKIQKYEDVAMITHNSKYENANDLAHQYLEEILKKSNSEKKLCIMLTDGLPACGYSGGSDKLMSMTIKAIQKTRNKGIHVFGVFLGSRGSAEQNMKRMYGKHFVRVDDVESARTEIMKEFKNNVIAQMRSM